ncbi:group I truncated hemoglobin [Tundrisphaera lichenicola]|uniref:group I truncated hemoglobin n=1 Tax=Tundrisphaera lichenicola TaxID=2029860 RepID=UPI003EC016CD
MATLYEELGGAPAVEAAVELFYRKMLMDDRVAHFFDDTDMERQMAKQAAFLTMVFGGPHQYTGRDMREGHKHLVARGLNDSHVDIVIGHLGDTLRELGVGEEQIRKVADLANSVRDDVLNREPQLQG